MEREEIKKLLKLMLDTSWTGAHGDHSALCQHCEMVAVWFQLAFMLFEAVFTVNPRAEDETLNAVAFGSLVRSGSSLSKAASFRSTGLNYIMLYITSIVSWQPFILAGSLSQPPPQ